MKPEFDMTFRDRLALDRTYLAKERTVLAYVRTGLALIGVALFVYRFMDLEQTQKLLLSVVLALPGIIIVLYGLYKTAIRRTERREFERGCMMVGDDEK